MTMSDKAYPSGMSYKIGDICIYRHQDVEGSGRIIAMGRDGCWIESLEKDPWKRRRCTVRHEAIQPRRV
jgi:hypothetical protein